ncbi:Right handed beta helix region [Filimonas lacunae]|uniref:Right handed beta helix region n=1 Tax=Filimonas lacunae TaxID=477680 RepID=A0A173MPV0_9BACT|nr:right-handed parallel beta-helix repeat-containing protein [Filimonas lacunae]BAV09460.1 hypothetical protein FLA_5509 [Filimonas lacunae]SIS73578.1 Right handed beta helix region [Filimonas lacunae]
MNQATNSIVAAFVCACACFGHIGHATAQTGITYYVDAAAGNDACKGTDKKQAWKTLNRVNAHRFAAGDSLLLKAGEVFEGCLQPKRSDKVANGLPGVITIASYGPGAKPEIRAAGKSVAAIHLYNTQGWQVMNLAVSNTGTERAPGRCGVWVELNNYGVARHIRLQQLEVKEVNGSLVKNKGGGAGIIVSNTGKQTPSWYEDVWIEHCVISNCARNGILINGNWERHAWLPNKQVVIRGNVIEGVPGDGIVPTGCDSALVEYNRMKNCPRLLPDGEAAAGIWPWSCDNTVIQYNEVSDHKAPWDGQGFDADWNCNNTVIQYNYSHDNEGGFLLICDDGGVKHPVSAGNTGTVVRYNISINDGFRSTGRHAGFSPLIHVPGPVKNARIYNNLVVRKQRAGSKLDSNFIAFDNWGGFAADVLLANNMFCLQEGTGVKYGNSSLIRFCNNMYYGLFPILPEDSFAIIQPPAFVTEDVFAGNQPAAFRLKDTASCAGHGIPIGNKPLKDYFGNWIGIGEKPSVGIQQCNR